MAAISIEEMSREEETCFWTKKTRQNGPRLKLQMFQKCLKTFKLSKLFIGVIRNGIHKLIQI